MNLNWGWIFHRAAFWRCRHDWMVGARTTGQRACRKCGTWRWFPILPNMSRPSAPPELDATTAECLPAEKETR